MKLSELLNLAEEALDENALHSNAKTLHIIAPALVAVAKTAMNSDASGISENDSDWLLRDAMREAGVSCD